LFSLLGEIASDRVWENGLSEMTEREPTLSIGMPLYNAGSYLRSALDTLLAQDETSFELLISDNVSTDGTEEVCREYAQRDPRIRYMRLTEHVGPGENFLAVLGRARAPYFMWAAHDDRWEPTFVSRIVGELKRNPDALLGFCQFDVLIHATGGSVPVPRISMPFGGTYFETCLAFMRNPVSNAFYGIFRRDALVVSAWSRAGLCDFSDILLVLEMATRGSILIVPDLLFHAGVVGGPTRAPKSFARSRRKGFDYAYGEYYRRAARLLWNAPHFSIVERVRLQLYLAGQVLTMMSMHERAGMSRLQAMFIDVTLRLGKRFMTLPRRSGAED
jgi:glycosyltransferase involved in cell wall biosynthesis